MLSRPCRYRCSSIFAILCFWLSGFSGAVSAEPDGLELFEKQIRPTLVDQCIRCHGEKKQQGGLRLDSREGWLSGGDSGPAIIPGKPDESLLVSAVRYESTDLEMPPNCVLPKSTIAAIEKWVALGSAPDPRSSQPSTNEPGDGPPSVEEGRKFWSFQPIGRPGVPEVVNRSWPRTDIDRFVLSRLEQNKLEPVADADRITLIRRVYFDLIGLPPTPEQIEAYLGDDSPTAYANLIDTLLDSPQFGQRWGRHWLDVVRFAESSGGGRTLLFPEAWRYRDYVIECFNEDFPYDQFLREQIAGDLLESHGWQDKQRKLIATAFLLLGPTNYELQDKDILEMDVVDEQLDTIGKGMLGMTIGCARCHDHKFDPIPTHDYYAMAGILKSTKAMIHSNVSKWNTVGLPLPPEQEAAVKAHQQELAAVKAELSEATKAWKKAGGSDGKNKKTASPVDPKSLPGIVVDDDQAQRKGQWTESTSVGGYVGAHYIHDGTAEKGKKSVEYKLDLPEVARYEVRVSYTPSTNRSTRVPIHIHHSGGETVVRVNQKKAPKIEGRLESLGTFEFDPAGQPRIVISNEGTEDGVVIADAVVLVPLDLPPLPKPDEVDIPENIAFIVQDPKKLAGTVVDDVDAKLVGDWKHSVHTPPFVGTSYIHDDKDGKGEKSATFTPDLPAGGTYEVRISHNTNVRRADNVPVTIRHADGESVVMINEGEEAPIDKLFRPLGKFRFAAGQEGSVTIANRGTDGKYVIVDAVQFIPIDKDAEEKQARVKRLKAEVDAITKQLKQLEQSAPKRPIAMATGDDSDAGDIHLAIRGVVHNKGPITPRGVLQVASFADFPAIPDGQSGRKELADWISNPQNPLTARVMANRVWYWLVGQGIVSTVDNFGSMGQPPSHPELLDHLAASLIDNGWSVKSLIREIMLSRVYTLGTDKSDVALRVDPENRLLWRMNRKRLRAEDIRDSLLFVSGQLDQSHGGSNIKSGTNSEYGYKFESRRRSVYVPVFRNTLPELFEVFDFADPNIQSGKRNESTIASQALLLMNHPLVIEQTKNAAAELLKDGPSETIPRVRRAYRQVLGRVPNDEELAFAVEFIEAGSQNMELQTRWAMLYQTLFQSVDFRYLN